MKRILVIISILAVIGLATPIMWGVTEFGIKKTSDVEFCGGCHSMEPMASSYLQDVHGGNNAAGIRATCSDCHLPHTSSFAYLKQKSINGAWDVWVEYVVGAEDIDWHKKRERREEYTYQSGCLHCHEALEQATTTPATLVAHGPMLRGESDASCVSCHEHVGHYRLADALSNYTGATIQSE
ncbi:MAG: NapC/NirT family cytochrome c [Pseudomonadales bacterium]|nr:NapC/NirT family cytochrome c [Pseudomonadales bacterium]